MAELLFHPIDTIIGTIQTKISRSSHKRDLEEMHIVIYQTTKSLEKQEINRKNTTIE